MRSKILLAAFVLGGAIGVTTTINACSGKTENGGGASSGASGSGTGTGTGSSSGDAAISSGTQNHPDCPAANPADGTPCTKDDLLCEYGDDFNPLCNVVRICAGKTWGTTLSHSNRPKCPTSVPTIPPNPATCPAARASIPKGQACDNGGDAADSTCAYDGSTCTCGVFCSSYPVRRPDCDADAGITENCCDTKKVAWYCFDGPPVCKTPRPRVGSTCTTEGDKCALSEPGECGQPILACTKGVWSLPNGGCPISTRRAKEEIAYVDRAEGDRLHDQLMSTQLATYRYKRPELDGTRDRHLGFIIEDMPEGSAAVLPTRDRVDLYGYTSMTVASLQHQQREIDDLKAEVAKLRELQRQPCGSTKSR